MTVPHNVSVSVAAGTQVIRSVSVCVLCRNEQIVVRRTAAGKSTGGSSQR